MIAPRHRHLYLLLSLGCALAIGALVLQTNRRARQPRNLTEKEYLAFLARKPRYFSGTFSAEAGPASVRLNPEMKKLGSLRDLFLQVRMGFLPNFNLGADALAKISGLHAWNRAGRDLIGDPESGAGNFLVFREKAGLRQNRLEAELAVPLREEVRWDDIQAVAGDLTLTLPVNIQAGVFALTEVGRSREIHHCRVTLTDVVRYRKSLQEADCTATDVWLRFEGPASMYVAVLAYSWGSLVPPFSHKAITETAATDNLLYFQYLKPVRSVKILVAANPEKRRYPFLLKEK